MSQYGKRQHKKTAELAEKTAKALGSIGSATKRVVRLIMEGRLNPAAPDLGMLSDSDLKKLTYELQEDKHVPSDELISTTTVLLITAKWIENDADKADVPKEELIQAIGRFEMFCGFENLKRKGIIDSYSMPARWYDPEADISISVPEKHIERYREFIKKRNLH